MSGNDDGFTLVSRKKRGKRRTSLKIEKSSFEGEQYPNNGEVPSSNGGNNIDRVVVEKRILDAKEELIISDFYTSFKHALNKFQDLKSTNEDKIVGNETLKFAVDAVVCYGLGNFLHCAIARYQLALLMLICEFLKIAFSNCHVYDPRFTTEEIEILTSFGLSVMLHNEECKRAVSVPTVFYMPHCGKPLYNNLLWANWSRLKLSNIVVIGNSFSNIQQRFPERVLMDEFRYLHRILPYTSEVPVLNNFHFSDIFNDTSIHAFPSEQLAEIPSAFWEENDEPNYDSDTEIICHRPSVDPKEL